nr:transporter substrate-binding domain-containing protein [Bowmanella yangjiangensis]
MHLTNSIYTACQRPGFLLLLALLLSFDAQASSLRVVTEISPPAQTWEEDRVGGIVTERVRKVVNGAGFQAEIQAYPWARAYEQALAGPSTLIYAMAKTPEREAQFKWIGPVGRYRLGFLKLKRNQDITITQLEQGRRYITAVQRQDVAVDVLMQSGFEQGKQLFLTADIQQSWELLRKGKVDLIIEDPDVIDEMLHNLNLTQQDVEFVYMIPELDQLTYLAASLDTNDSLVEKLRLSLYRQDFSLNDL